MRTWVRLVAISVALVLAGVGCGGTEDIGSGSPPMTSPSTVESSSPATSTDAPSPDAASEWDDIVAFSEAVAERDWDAAAEFVSPNSAADRYVQFQSIANEAQTAAGYPSNEVDSTVVSDKAEGTVEVTVDYSEGEPNTFVWSEFRVDSDGKIITWTAESGPLEERLWTQPAKAKAAGATVSLASAYQTNAGDLYVVLDVTADEIAVTPDFEIPLVGKDKRTRQSSYMYAPEQIQEGTAAYVLYVFEDANFGGTIEYEVLDRNYQPQGTVRLLVE